jgi:hypothetical protein
MSASTLGMVTAVLEAELLCLSLGEADQRVVGVAGGDDPEEANRMPKKV